MFPTSQIVSRPQWLILWPSEASRPPRLGITVLNKLQYNPVYILITVFLLSSLYRLQESLYQITVEPSTKNWFYGFTDPGPVWSIFKWISSYHLFSDLALRFFFFLLEPSLWLQVRGNNQRVKWGKRKAWLLFSLYLSLPLLCNFPGLRGCRSCMKMKLLHPFSSDGGFCIKHLSVWTWYPLS